jgi:uncharacterized sulfatase
MHWKIRMLGSGLLAFSVTTPAAERPNILWRSSEDNATLLGCYSDPMASTPTLD